MTTREWTVRPLTPDDRDGVLDLFRRVFGESDVSREWWDWKYLENPAGLAVGYVAEVGTRIVGQYPAFPRRFSVGGRHTMVVLAGDVMVDPEFRRQGMFIELARRTYKRAQSQGFDVVFGFPNSNTHYAYISGLGWTDVLPCAPLWLKPLSGAGIAARYLPYIGSTASRPIAWMEQMLRRIPRRQSKGAGQVCIREVTVADELMDVVSASVARLRTVTAVRDSEYLRWRYLARPDQQYYAVVGFVDGAPVAYAVYCVRVERGLMSGFIMELEICGEDAPVIGPRLCSYVTDRLRNQGVAVVSSLTMPSSRESRVLRAAGFFRCPKRLMPRPLFLGHLMLGGDDAVPGLFAAPSSWYVSWGDHDVA